MMASVQGETDSPMASPSSVSTGRKSTYVAVESIPTRETTDSVPTIMPAVTVTRGPILGVSHIVIPDPTNTAPASGSRCTPVETGPYPRANWRYCATR